MSLREGLPTSWALLRLCCPSQSYGHQVAGLPAWGRMGEIKYESPRRI